MCRNKMLTGAELFLPVYIILFLLMIRRLDVIPYEVIYTPAAAAAPKHSIFAPPPIAPTILTAEQTLANAEMMKIMMYNVDALRLGVAPRDGVAAKRVAAGLCEWIAGVMAHDVSFKTAYGSGNPCYGVEMFIDGDSLYETKGRFDMHASGLDIGVVVDEARLNFTLVHHEFLLLNMTSGFQTEAATVNSRLLMFQAIVSSLLAPSSIKSMPSPALALSPSHTLTPYMQEFPTAERWEELNALKFIFSIQFIMVFR